jgi:hypothetical protein
MGPICSSHSSTEVLHRLNHHRHNNNNNTNTKTTEKQLAHYQPRDSSDALDNVPPRPLSGMALKLTRELDEEDQRLKDLPLDPILLTRIRKNSLIFEFKRNSQVIIYRASSLIDFILATGIVSEPETRIPFTHDDVVRLDQLGSQLGKESILDAMKTTRYKEMKETHDALDGVERLAGANIYAILRLLEKAKNMDETQLQLVTKLLPELKHHVSLMFQTDPEGALMATNHLRNFLVGPPNRPTRDPTQLLQFVLTSYDDMVAESASYSMGVR